MPGYRAHPAKIGRSVEPNVPTPENLEQRRTRRKAHAVAEMRLQMRPDRVTPGPRHVQQKVYRRCRLLVEGPRLARAERAMRCVRNRQFSSTPHGDKNFDGIEFFARNCAEDLSARAYAVFEIGTV